jgi:hypothetical protein
LHRNIAAVALAVSRRRGRLAAPGSDIPLAV